MKKHLYLFFTILVASIVLMGASCDDDSPVTATEGVVKQISSTTGGNLESKDGSEIIVPAGSILDGDNGTAGNISFSIETNVKNLPMPIPSGMTVIGGVTLFGPANFTFVEPIRLWLAAENLTSLEDIGVIKFSEANSKWYSYPISDIDAEKKRIGVASFELGFFAIVKHQSGSMKVPSIDFSLKSGGIRYDHPSMSNYYITLMVGAFTPKNSNDAGTINIGWNTSTGSKVTGGPLTTTHMVGIPQGTYQIIVSRVRAGTLSQLPGEREYYSLPATVTVNGFTNTQSWDWYNWAGWTNLSLPGGGTWTTSQPSVWPAPTKPFGTGDFQATLTWVNSSSSATDLDLHLFGPNGIHVYYWEEKSADGSIELDRDWMSEYGNAVENIYSLKTMPKGDYSVYVNVFSGDVPKSFDVRIIRKGTSVKTFRGTGTQLNAGFGSEDKSKMVLIDKFKL